MAGTADMRGEEKRVNRGVGAEAGRSVRQYQPCHEAQLCSAFLLPSSTGLVGILPPNPIIQGITASPCPTCKIWINESVPFKKIRKLIYAAWLWQSDNYA